MYTHRTTLTIPFVGTTEVALSYAVQERQMAFHQCDYWPELQGYKILTPFISDAARLRADSWLADNQEKLNIILEQEANWQDPD